MATTAEIATAIQESLKEGSYACTSLTILLGGTANFVFRGTLAAPLPDGSRTVVIKHTEGYVASKPAFKLSATRSDFEQVILRSLDGLPASEEEGITVTTPHLYFFSPESNTQVYSDLPFSTELKTYALTHPLTRAQCSRLGRALGTWARSFHGWAAAPEQEALRRKIDGNVAMRDLKYAINYTALLARVEKYPTILGSSREIFEAVARETREDLDKQKGVLIHGDFWTGNVLLPNAPFPSPTSPLKVFIIDWELSQLSSIAFDLGQMFAELFELKHFQDVDAGVWLIEAFMESYGRINRGLAFKTAIHVGAHLVRWGSGVQGWGTKEQVEAVVGIGRDWVVKGWEKDAEFFKGTALKCLYD